MSLWQSSLALVGASTQVSLPVVAFSAPARKRFLFWPGVSTYLRCPLGIQSRPIFGLRWTSISSSKKTGSAGLALRARRRSSENALPARGIPGARDPRLWHPKPRAYGVERSTHRAGGHARQVVPLQLTTEQLARPGRALPAELRRDGQQHALELLLEASIHLADAVEGAPIKKAVLAGLGEPPCRFHDGGRDTREITRDLLPRQSLSEFGDHQESERVCGSLAFLARWIRRRRAARSSRGMLCTGRFPPLPPALPSAPLTRRSPSSRQAHLPKGPYGRPPAPFRLRHAAPLPPHPSRRLSFREST